MVFKVGGMSYFFYCDIFVFSGFDKWDSFLNIIQYIGKFRVYLLFFISF